MIKNSFSRSNNTPWRVGRGKFRLQFSIRYVFCPCGLPLFQLRDFALYRLIKQVILLLWLSLLSQIFLTNVLLWYDSCQFFIAAFKFCDGRCHAASTGNLHRIHQARFRIGSLASVHVNQVNVFGKSPCKPLMFPTNVRKNSSHVFFTTLPSDSCVFLRVKIFTSELAFDIFTLLQ